MKRVYGAKELLLRAKNEAKKQDKRRIKRQVKRHDKKLVAMAGARAARSPEVTTVESSDQK